MEEVRKRDKLLAIVWRDADWAPGLDFCTPDELFVQAGTWQYPAGKKLAAHAHKHNERTATLTQEVTYVKRGRMKVSIFDENRELVRELVLEAGDFAVMVAGGHGYEILEDGTQVLEVKNGPFLGVEQDKDVY
jgi:oxalate decarboxylase/phosphoglucose isomerase-like protein (cupin superfamily)